MAQVARLLFPSGKLVTVPAGIAHSLGRADVARYAEASIVSRCAETTGPHYLRAALHFAPIQRVQCTVQLLHNDTSTPSLQLSSCGVTNPTLALPRSAPPVELTAGQTALLHDGDAFSLICTRPDLSIRVEMADTAAAALGPGPAEAGSEPQPAAALPPTALAGPDVPGGAEEVPAAGSQEASPGEHGTLPYSDVSSGGYRTGGTDDGDGGSDDDRGAQRSPRGGGGASSGEGGTGGAAGQQPRPKAPKAAPQGVSNGKPPAQAAPPVLLLLAGLPGSGKSTFARSLLQASPVAWVHVNQDAIRDGRPGKRQACVQAARNALLRGVSCVLDRCHGTVDQRRDFVALAAQLRVPAHCVVLQLPVATCASRVASRTDHPGGVQGDGAKRVVYQMSGMVSKQQQADARNWPPGTAEGYASVMECSSDADANAALRAWAAYGSSGAPYASASAAATAPSAAAAAAAARADSLPAIVGAAAASDAAAAGPGPGASGSGGGGSGGPHTGSGAAGVGSPAARTLALWDEHVAKRKPPAGSITAFFKPQRTAAQTAGGGSGGASAASAAAGGARGAAASAAKAAPVGSSGAVGGKGVRATARGQPAAASTAGGGQGKGAAKGQHAAPLHPPAKRSGADAASHEPSPKRPAVAAAEPAAGSDGSAARTGAGATPGGTGARAASQGDAARAAPANAFAVLMDRPKRPPAAAASAGASGSTPRGRAPSGSGAGGAGGGAGDDVDHRFRLTSPWAQPLRVAALDPDNSGQKVVYKDDKAIMILDAYPKARHHALVIARDPGLRSIANLRGEHVPLLEHMRGVAETWAREQRRKDPSTVAFKLGFHAVPSMCQLHMHVVSQDFDSPSLKNKKHWNSFTSSFFLLYDAVVAELSAAGRLALMGAEEEKRLESQALCCHGCGRPSKTIPELKQHIVGCAAVKRLPGL